MTIFIRYGIALLMLVLYGELVFPMRIAQRLLPKSPAVRAFIVGGGAAVVGKSSNVLSTKIYKLSRSQWDKITKILEQPDCDETSDDQVYEVIEEKAQELNE